MFSSFPHLAFIILAHFAVPSPLLPSTAPVEYTFPVPPGWYAGDLHIHQPWNCWGVAPPEEIFEAMPHDLNVAAVLLWGAGGLFEQNAQDYFLGQQDDPISTPTKIVHYDLEVSAFTLADRLGHIGGIYLEDVYFPEYTYAGPIQQWIHDQGAYVGGLHIQTWTDTYYQFPPIVPCCTPFELPIDVALGRVDYVDYQGPNRDSWRTFWYGLLHCGFRPGLAASSDSYCLEELGSYRTYARIDGDLSYLGFIDAVANGRTVAVELGANFVHFTVDSVEVGEQIDVSLLDELTLSATAYLPPEVICNGTLEIIRNGEVIGSQPYAQAGGEVTLTLTDTVVQSSWYAARTERSHTGAVFAIVGGRPIRTSPLAANHFRVYCGYLTNSVEGGLFPHLTLADKDSLLADIARAEAIYEQIYFESVAVSAVAGDPPAAPPRVVARTHAWPNPFANDLTIEYDIGMRGAETSEAAPGAAAGAMGEPAVGGPLEIVIHGIGGRLVRRLRVPLAREALGSGTIVWDGLDETGVPVPSGVYYYRLDAAGQMLGGGCVVRVR
jgi:hypothetical protein